VEDWKRSLPLTHRPATSLRAKWLLLERLKVMAEANLEERKTPEASHYCFLVKFHIALVMVSFTRLRPRRGSARLGEAR